VGDNALFIKLSNFRIIFLSSPMRNVSLEPTKKNRNLSKDSFWVLGKFWLQLILIFQISFLFFQCGLDVEDPTPPPPPVWVQKSLPKEWPERGIDAHESDGIFLEWHKDTYKEIIATYSIYRAKYFGPEDSLGQYELIVQLDPRSRLNLEYVDWNVDIGSPYFYKIISQDITDNRSLFSDSISYTLLSTINAEWVHPNGNYDVLGEDRKLNWWYPPNIEMEDYCITILSSENDLILREIIVPNNYTGGWDSWQIPLQFDFEVNMVYQWRIDTGAKYIDGYEVAGSESYWATFLYQGI
jgi:hypothetical protein